MPKLEIEGLATDYAAGALIELHSHDAHQVIHASAGVMRVTSERTTWVVPPGRAIWMPAGRVHGIHCHTPVAMRTVYIRGTLSGLPAECAVWAVSPLMREILVRIATRPAPAGRSHLIALLLAEIEEAATLPLALPLPADPRLRRLAEAVFAAPAEPHALAGWARRLGLSERSLIRKFNAETGMTFRQWRRQARLLEAVERLAAGDPVTTVAFAVGYESLSAFIAAFRETMGETPRRFALAGRRPRG